MGVEFGRREIGKVTRYFPHKKKQNFAWLSSSQHCTARIATNIWQASPRQCSQSAPDFIQIGPLLVQL